MPWRLEGCFAAGSAQLLLVLGPKLITGQNQKQLGRLGIRYD